MKNNLMRNAFCGLATLCAVLAFCALGAAQNSQEKGVINGRSGVTMTIQTQDFRGNHFFSGTFCSS
jgi:hypothetical protein